MLFRIIKHLWLLCLLMTFTLQGKSQQIISFEELPDPVKRFFPVVYDLEDSILVQWTFEDTIYVARFVSDNYPVEVRLKANGFWVNTFWDIDQTFIPEAIHEFCRKNYPDYSVERCRISNNAFDERYYFISLSGQQDQTLLRFSLNGKIYK